MTQSTLTPASPIVPHRDTLDEIVSVRFTPSDPIGLTVVDVAGDPDPARLLALLDAAAERLAVYAHAYRDAMNADAA